MGYRDSGVLVFFAYHPPRLGLWAKWRGLLGLDRGTEPPLFSYSVRSRGRWRVADSTERPPRGAPLMGGFYTAGVSDLGSDQLSGRWLLRFESSETGDTAELFDLQARRPVWRDEQARSVMFWPRAAAEAPPR